MLITTEGGNKQGFRKIHLSMAPLQSLQDVCSSQGFSGGSEVKASACNVGDPVLIPGSGRSPGEGNGNPLQYSCLENPLRQRSLVSYSPWGLEESDMIE